MYHEPRWSTSHQTDLCRSRPPLAGLLIYQHLPLLRHHLHHHYQIHLPCSFHWQYHFRSPLSSPPWAGVPILSPRQFPWPPWPYHLVPALEFVPSLRPRWHIHLSPDSAQILDRAFIFRLLRGQLKDRPVPIGRCGSPAISFLRRLPDCRGIWHRRRGTACPHRSRYDLLQRHPAQRGDRTHMCSFKHL